MLSSCKLLVRSGAMRDTPVSVLCDPQQQQPHDHQLDDRRKLYRCVATSVPWQRGVLFSQRIQLYRVWIHCVWRVLLSRHQLDDGWQLHSAGTVSLSGRPWSVLSSCQLLVWSGTVRYTPFGVLRHFVLQQHNHQLDDGW